MTRINTNMPALIAVNDLGRNNAELNETLRRLSSGLRINQAGDDPSGLIISELLRGQIGALKQAVNNSQRATNVIATAEGALNEVSSLLINIMELTIQAANTGALTGEEIHAAQLQVDSAVQSITRIANTTTFGGTALLNGNLAYVTSGVATSITDLSINSIQFRSNAFVPVVIEVISAAQAAQLHFPAAGLTAAQDITLEIAGGGGVETLSFTGSTANSAIVFALNTVSDATGVSASLSGVMLVFSSTEEGTDVFVSVKALNGAFETSLYEAPATLAQRDIGADVNAKINGAQAVATGNRVSLNTTALSLDLELASGWTGTTSFAATGGGALFQLGAGIASNEQVNIGIRSVAAGRLGSPNTGFLSEITTGGRFSLISGNTREALEILNQSILQVATTRGRLGSFQLNTLETNIAALSVAIENATAAESMIRDADFAQETANLTRAQILVSAGTSVLATATTTPQSVLQLLG